MALTNLLTSSEELRCHALHCGAWNGCKELFFSDNEQALEPNAMRFPSFSFKKAFKRKD